MLRATFDPARLLALRKERDYSVQDVARLLFKNHNFTLTPQAIYNHENGLYQPTLEVVRAYAVLFGVTPDSLCTNVSPFDQS